MEKTDLLGLTEEELMDLAKAAGEAPFRGKQIFKWLSRDVRDFDEMTDLPVKLLSLIHI